MKLKKVIKKKAAAEADKLGSRYDSLRSAKKQTEAQLHDAAESIKTYASNFGDLVGNAILAEGDTWVVGYNKCEGAPKFNESLARTLVPKDLLSKCMTTVIDPTKILRLASIGKLPKKLVASLFTATPYTAVVVKRKKGGL